VTASSPIAPDLEAASAEEVLAHVVERFHPRLYVACSFQKEASVIMDMLLKIEPSARFFTLDTDLLFEETYETKRRLEARAKDLSLPVEFNLENMQHFVDWERHEPYKVVRGEGECAV
jgi:3'-phosphoadenosine 5'-phosphosulfate sulfotransferase (PAPS reductase)/FAD synthetase